MILEGRVALIMGGGRGIGAATARLLAARGAHVVIGYLQNATAAEQVVVTIRSNGGDATAVQADVRNTQQVQTLVQRTHERYGQIDILVYSVPPQGVFKPFLSLSWDEFLLGVSSHLKGAFEMAQAVLPLMQQQHYGRIIYVSSAWAKSPSMEGLSSLGPAFAAQVNLVKALAKEYGPAGITVNTIAPGVVETELSANIPLETKQYIAAATPLQRIADPEDIAHAVAFFASDDSQFLTGTYLPVSGGFFME